MQAPIEDVQNATAYWLMKYALGNSNTYDSIKLRLGNALLAQQRIGQARSLPLKDDHWEYEAAQLLATSLARAQFDAWSIACGEDHERPGYKDLTPDQVKGKLCGLYKFNKDGYINIELGAFIGLLLVWPITFILARETKRIKEMLKYCLEIWKSKVGRGKAQDKKPADNGVNADGSNGAEIRAGVTDMETTAPGDVTAGDSHNSHGNVINRKATNTGPLNNQTTNTRANLVESVDAEVTDANAEDANAVSGDNLSPGAIHSSSDGKLIGETWEPLLINSLLGYIFIPIRYLLYGIVALIGWTLTVFCIN